MKRNLARLFFLMATALALVSCSGLPQSGGPPPVGGTTTFSLTAIDAPPPGSSILSYKLTITGITLTPASGSPVTLNLGSSNPVIELTRLQSESAFLGTFSVTSGTYSSITVALSNPDVVFLNQSGGTVGGTLNPCPNNTVCEAKPAAAGAPQITFSPSLTLNSNGQQGLDLDFNPNNTLTFSGGNIGVDLAQANILSTTILPRGGLSSGQLDLIEDFTGVVTSVDQPLRTLTIQSATRGTLNAKAPPGFIPDDPFGFCTTLDFSCVQLNQTVSVDAILNADGTFSLQELEPFDSVAVDRIEAVVVSTQSSTQFQIVTTDKVQTANTVLNSVITGDAVNVTLAGGAVFFVDPKGHLVPQSALQAFQGVRDTGVLLPGQTVSVRVTNFTAASGNTRAAATVDEVGLRYSRVSGTVSGPPGSPFFNITGLPPIITNSTPSPPPFSVETFAGTTNFDGVTNVTQLANNDSVSISALYINVNNLPALFAAKVRKH